MFDPTQDGRVRVAAFEWLADLVAMHGDVLPRNTLAGGFILDGIQVHVLGPQGIFRPRVLKAPLSITTAPEGPYDDSFGPDDLLRYRYRGTDPDHPDNQGLRVAMQHRLPLIYFHGIAPGKYLATWPVFVVGDDPALLAFSIAVDDADHIGLRPGSYAESLNEEGDSARRAYVTAVVRVRLHQRAFRERVLEAYQRQCAFCRLRFEQLLDAAHIIPDTEAKGEPLVRNGLALCNLHHAAFDRHFLGLRPDYVIEVRADVLRQHDGPTLVYAIQALHGTRISLPSRSDLWPARDLLELRYSRFQHGSAMPF